MKPMHVGLLGLGTVGSGTIGAIAPGEADLSPLDAAVGRLLDEARRDGTLARERLALDAVPPAAPGPLRFPSRVIALPGERLAVEGYEFRVQAMRRRRVARLHVNTMAPVSEETRDDGGA